MGRHVRLMLVGVGVALAGCAPVKTPGGPAGAAGPYLHQVVSATSTDGVSFTADGVVLVDHASVPDAIVAADGSVLLYYVDASGTPETTGAARSTDGGATFTKVAFSIAGLPANTKALDPNVVLLPDGRYRLYYYGAAIQGAGGVNSPGPHTIYSAVSTDGVSFTQEGAVFTYNGLVDPDVFWDGTQWVMYVFSLGQGTVVATSATGLSFTHAGPLSVQGIGTTGPLDVGGGQFRLFGFVQPDASSFVSYISSDAGTTWTQEPGTRLTVDTGQHITDPQVVQLPSGTWKMFYKTSAAV